MIVLFFILTHGVGSQTDANTAFNSELYLATSDASQETIKGTGLKSRAELLDSFRMLPNGSSIFLFIDTCDAASISSAGLQRELNADEDHRMMILAASKATQKAYKARFTRTLQRLWEKPATSCTKETAIETLVTRSMDIFFPVSVPSSQKQEVKLVLPFTQDFCIESFGASQSLLLVGNSSTNKDIDIYWRENGTLQDSEKIPVAAGKIHVLNLLRKQYRLHADIDDANTVTIPVDLEKGPSVQLVIPNAAPSSAEASSLRQEALNIVETSGVSVNAIEAFREKQRNELESDVLLAQQKTLRSNQEAARWKAELDAIAERDRAVVAQAESARQSAESARAEISTCCRHTIAGIQTVDSAALQQKVSEAQEAAQSVSRLEAVHQQLAIEKAQEELGAAQAQILAVQEQANLGQAQSAARDFTDTVKMRDVADRQLKEGQHKFADRLASPMWQTARTDRGVVLSINGLALQPKPTIPPPLGEALANLGDQVRTAVPDALIEVEAYAEDGNAETADLIAQSVAGFLKGPPDRGTIITRGFGFTVSIGESGQPTRVPPGVNIVISAISLGYPERSVRNPARAGYLDER